MAEIDYEEQEKTESGPSKSKLADKWEKEISASLEMLGDFHDAANKVLDRYLDNRGAGETGDSRINLFWSNTKTLESVLYSNLPTVDVSRKFEDYGDDVARVGANLMKRVLNYDIIENGSEYETVLKQGIQDRLIVGLGCARLFYEVETEQREVEPIVDPTTGQELAPGFTEEVAVYEGVPCEYYFWGDVCWSWARTWKDLRWIAFRSYLSKKEAKKRFGDDVVNDLDFKRQQPAVGDNASSPDASKELRQKAEVWEIWDKETGKVYWWSEGCDNILDVKDDPLGLKGFFPCPRFMVANATTQLLVPKPDYSLIQDLLIQIDVLQTRISMLIPAVKVVGVYDKSSDGVKRMLMEGVENTLIPVDNWAMFAEKGGIQGQIDWLPLEQVVDAIAQLRQIRDDNIFLLQRVTGMSDILLGNGTNPREGVGTQELKAELGSVRIQSLQEELARYATDICELKAEIISKHFRPETILKMSNAEYLPEPDKQLIQPAIQFLKDWGTAALRIKIRSESMAMVDYTKLKNERTEYINAISLFMQSAAPIMESSPGAAPVLMELLKWGLAGFKGSDQIEGVIDRAIEDMTKNQGGQAQQEDPAVQREKIKAQAEMQMAQLQGQLDLQKIEAKRQADIEVTQAKFQADLALIQAKNQGDIQKEEAQSAFATMQKEVDTRFDLLLAERESELRKEEIEEQGEMGEEGERGDD